MTEQIAPPKGITLDKVARSIQGLRNSLRATGKPLNSTVVEANLAAAKASSLQISTFAGVLRQIDMSNQLAEAREICPNGGQSEEALAIKMKLAGWLNSTVGYLALLEQENRMEVLRILDGLAFPYNQEQWKVIRKGLINATGIYRLVREVFGNRARLPTPKEDVENGIDLVVEDTYLQLKAKGGLPGMQIFHTAEELEQYYQPILETPAQDKRGEDYHQRLRKEILGMERLVAYCQEVGGEPAFVIIPSAAIDFKTCEPTGRVDLTPLESLGETDES